MVNKKVDLIVQKEQDTKSKTADGYVMKKSLELHGADDLLTIKVTVSGYPKDVEKFSKSLDLIKLDNKCKMTFSKNPQTSLEDHLEDEDEDP